MEQMKSKGTMVTNIIDKYGYDFTQLMFAAKSSMDKEIIGELKKYIMVSLMINKAKGVVLLPEDAILVAQWFKESATVNGRKITESEYAVIGKLVLQSINELVLEQEKEHTL